MHHEKICFCCMQQTKVQTILGICAVGYVPLLFSFWKIWAMTQENMFSDFANKVADQPAHRRILVSTFVIHVWKVSYRNML